MQKLIPSLWFDNNCKEAMEFYISVFPNSKISSIRYYPTDSNDEHLKGMDGKVLHAEFELNGLRFFALDGGPVFKFNEAVSFTIICEDQEEIDYYWEKLAADPDDGQCGWTKDRFGVSWQIIPANMQELVGSTKAMDALLKMKKIDIAVLKDAE